MGAVSRLASGRRPAQRRLERPRHRAKSRQPLRSRACRTVRRWLELGRAAGAPANQPDARCHAQHHRPQRQSRSRLRPQHQPLSRLRTWLHLLLRPPDPCLSRPVARPRFRDQDRLQARGGAAAGGGIVQAPLSAGRAGARHQYRSLSAGRAHAGPHTRHPGSAGTFQPSGQHRHEIRRRAARHRAARPHGGEKSRARASFHHHARPGSGAGDGTARRRPCPPPGDDHARC